MSPLNSAFADRRIDNVDSAIYYDVLVTALHTAASHFRDIEFLAPVGFGSMLPHEKSAIFKKCIDISISGAIPDNYAPHLKHSAQLFVRTSLPWILQILCDDWGRASFIDVELVERVTGFADLDIAKNEWLNRTVHRLIE